MAVNNPNPSRVTDAIWAFWNWFDQFEPTVVLGGIFAAKGGYHDIRNGHSGDYSVAEVAADRQGPGDKASAIDLTMSDAAMRKYTTRLDVAAKSRDERLLIGGVPIIREFIGTKDSSRVYCYVLTGGRARGLGADAAEDWGRDSTHLWHLHISIIRLFCASMDAMDRLYSVLNGEPISAWRARRAPEPIQEDDDVSQQIVRIEPRFGYNEGEQVIDRTAIAIVVAEPAGYGPNAVFGTKRLYLSAGADHTESGPVKLRVACHDGKGYQVSYPVIKSGPRQKIPLPIAAADGAYSITIGRMKTSADATEIEETTPLSVLVTTA